ncbi:hypothetical protein [Streptomyces sp. NPDC056817]|uniref:hypothetical protein n=1 Tax=Streptomyces sp. NPDC056817 TaxID=3345950 RepID=UPI0036A3B55F
MARATTPLAGYDGLAMYVGDIHNHCGISYGHGTIEEAYANARLQLDFASVTGHAWWPDMPCDDPELPELVAYHERGFARLARLWPDVQEVTAAAHADGEFVSFLSFEWHSMVYGDHCVYFDGPRGDIIRAADLTDLRQSLRTLAIRGVRTMAIPHHIGYHAGRRGINWQAYTPEFAPVVEMVSMHGCGESDDAPLPYLHTMGPRDQQSMAVHGLRLGHRFGFIGSTDHHSAHPGSHGYGRMAVWAPELTRDGIWSAVADRRTYAITGDRILLATTVNGTPMGGEAPAAGRRHIEAHVIGRSTLDYVEVVRGNHSGHTVVNRVNRPAAGAAVANSQFSGTLGFSVGWGKRDVPVQWDVQLSIEGGQLLDVQPRLHGEDVVAPADREPETYRFSDWGRIGERAVWLRTLTRGNPNTLTDATQGLSLRVVGDDNTRLVATVNGQQAERAIGELREGPRTGNIGGFVSGAYCFDRAVTDAERTATVAFDDDRPADATDWYYVRVRQTNDQWAWSSPTWVG